MYPIDSNDVRKLTALGVLISNVLFLVIVMSLVIIFLLYALPMVIASEVKVSYVTSLLPLYDGLSSKLWSGFALELVMGLIVVFSEKKLFEGARTVMMINMIITIIIITLCLVNSYILIKLTLTLHDLASQCAREIIHKQYYAIAIIDRRCLLEKGKTVHLNLFP
ncbi:MAG: hypothetical protein GXO26_01860 [Crenarchaeota archaeon]|nr:hypothetical protein [Thermoproteota archaeon]